MTGSRPKRSSAKYLRSNTPTKKHKGKSTEDSNDLAHVNYYVESSECGYNFFIFNNPATETIRPRHIVLAIFGDTRQRNDHPTSPMRHPILGATRAEYKHSSLGQRILGDGGRGQCAPALWD